MNMKLERNVYVMMTMLFFNREQQKESAGIN